MDRDDGAVSNAERRAPDRDSKLPLAYARRMSRRRLAIALVAAALLPAAARADAKLDAIRARGKLIVSVKNDAQRTHKDPAHQQKRGFEVELARALARHILGD